MNIYDWIPKFLLVNGSLVYIADFEVDMFAGSYCSAIEYENKFYTSVAFCLVLSSAAVVCGRGTTSTSKHMCRMNGK